MAVTNHGDKLNLTSTNDLSTKQHYLVKQSADEACVLAAASTDKVLGSLANKPKAGETAEIAKITGGATVKVILGGTVTRGAYLVSDANGKAIAVTAVAAGAAPTQEVFGRALQAGVLNDIIEVEGGYDVR